MFKFTAEANTDGIYQVTDREDGTYYGTVARVGRTWCGYSVNEERKGKRWGFTNRNAAANALRAFHETANSQWLKPAS